MTASHEPNASVPRHSRALPGFAPLEPELRRRQFAATPPRFFPVRAAVSGRLRFVVGSAAALALALAYAVLTVKHEETDAILPSFGAIASSAVELVTGADFWTDMEVSFFRVTAGFLAAAALAVPLDLFSSMLEPLSEFLRYIPVPALIPLVMIVAGIDESAKIALVFLGTFFQLLLMTADEVRRVPPELVDVSRSLGASRREVVWRVLTPSALPGISQALRICNGWAWSYVVVAELVAATEGLGFRVLRFYRFVQTANIYVYLIAFGCIGLTLDWLFKILHRRVFRWQAADT
jgi:NitT/TauT family transport system permease protein